MRHGTTPMVTALPTTLTRTQQLLHTLQHNCAVILLGTLRPRTQIPPTGDYLAVSSSDTDSNGDGHDDAECTFTLPAGETLDVVLQTGSYGSEARVHIVDPSGTQQLTADTALVHSTTSDPSPQPELTPSTTAIHTATDVTHRHSTVLVSFRLATHMSLEPPFQQPLPTEHRSTTMTTVTAT